MFKYLRREADRVKKPSGSDISKLQVRAGLWTTRAMRAAIKGDYDRAGALTTKAMKLSAQADDMHHKLRALEG